MMPGLNGLDTLEQISRRAPYVRTIVLSMHGDEEYVQRAINNGAWGYVLKNSTSSDLLQAVFAVMEGKHYLSPTLAQQAIEAYFRQAHTVEEDGGYQNLSVREREVLQLTAEGRSNAQIAEMLSISRRTVEGHRASLLRKLNLHSRVDLVRYAVRQGIVPAISDNPDAAASWLLDPTAPDSDGEV